MKECLPILRKNELSALDIIRMNQIIFPMNRDVEEFNQKHRSYSENDILQILEYQKQHCINNSQLAQHFKLSRNTVTKWKQLYL